jgi:cytochrome b561
MNDRTNFDTVTRIVAGDDKANYDNVAITLHWLTALLVITQFVLAVSWDYFPHDTRENLQSVHVSFGVLLTVVVVARILWRLGHHRSPIVSGWQKTASTAVHYLLYVLLVVQAGLGWSWRWAQGHAVSFFGLFAIPGPYGQVARPTRHLLAEFHQYIGWTIVIIAFGHALAALYHHYGLHDRVLGRMFPPARRSEHA